MPQPELREMAREVVARRFGLDFGENRAQDLDIGLERAFPGQPPEVVLARVAAAPMDAPEIRDLIQSLTIGETYFFRDAASFDALEHEILAPLIARRRTEHRYALRVWSAGCSTGEEPYSLAILLDRLLPDLASWNVTILATDINQLSLDAARRGRYRTWSLRETPDWVRGVYFRREGRDELELAPRIRDMVTFSRFNLADSTGELSIFPEGMDLILCRNVLMYFTREAQQGVASRFVESLTPEGWLVVSGAESSIELFRPLKLVTTRGAIAYQRASQLDPPSPEADTHPQQPSLLPVASSSPVHRTVLPRVRRPVRALAQDAPQSKGALALAREAADEGDLDRARTCCEQALSENPLDIGAYLLLADVCRECGDAVGARAALQRAIFLAPHDAAAHFALGTLLLKEGARADGRRSLETAIRILEREDESSFVPGSDGMTAGGIVQIAESFLRATEDPSTRLVG